MVFCDLLKVFEEVWYRGFLFKLYSYGFRGDFVNGLC